ncbi:hypothetical protein SLITO_v1c06140 [Spiroplasma litorale]|uniref:site-specific DNA-methyltransferase (adenine-specific) n=1 Tax=Spiroplasma litorale TaxID=216942 RepID=A0A0K1W247_9MOLU|nr:N-6 DNA methylase [Spiroplasma litorale]AKX34248.1 hypothetical protein SLITO_v1c06140 [Spiroplasma litorale]
MKSINSVKINERIIKDGVVYTPNYIVINMLDEIKYKGKKILNKHIVDNSCGEGAFLVEITKRYLKELLKLKKNRLDVKKHLEKYIHGIEIDPISYKICISNLNNVLLENGIKVKINWNIINGDTLECTQFLNKMDYVVGNPPYIRIHDLNIDYKKYNFCTKGMIDLYLIFFEIGLNMLNEKGKLIYITPNSYFTSNAANVFRKYLIDKSMLETVINLGHFNPFKGITTYPAITVISKIKNKKTKYKEYDSINNFNFEIDILEKKEFYINDCFYFSKTKQLLKFSEILNVKKNNDLFVRNGISTNLDSFFINDSYTGSYVVEAMKISKMKLTKMFYPYDEDGNTVPLNIIKNENKNMYNLLLNNKEILSKRSLQSQNWFEFARTQGIKDVNKNKLVINNIIKTVNTIKTKILKPGIVPYSGYYVISEKYDLKYIENLIYDQEFIEYLKILRKDKNGEYYFFSSNDLHQYLSYKIYKINQKN